MLLVLLASASLQAEQKSVTMLFGGDVMLAHWVPDHLKRSGLDYPFRAIQPLLQHADIRFCNLEDPIGKPDTTKRRDKKYTFALSAKYRGALNFAHFDIVNMANNHIMDFGKNLADSTLFYLNQLGIKSVGYGQNAESAPGPAILSKDGVTIGFLGYSMTFPKDFWATDSTAGTAYPDTRNFVNRIKDLNDKVDFTVVSFHWGAENSDSTKKYQQVFAHRAIDAGADLIIGHHPHVWQGLEIYKHRLIAYSLGNLSFGSFSPTAIESGLLQVQAGHDTIFDAKIFPLDVKNVEVRFQPRPVHGKEATHFLSELRRYSARFDSTSTLKIESDGELIW